MATDLLITTADEFFEMRDDAYRYELVNGVLKKTSPAGGEHGRIGLFLGAHLLMYVNDHNLGYVYGAETGFILTANRDTVLAPDVAFVSRGRAATIGDDRKFVPLAPDLVGEVLSPGDTYSETDVKIAQWLEAGTRAVLLVDPRRKTVTVYRVDSEPVVFNVNDALEVPEIVPGWSLPVAKVFTSL